MVYKNIGKHHSEIVTQYIYHELSLLFGNLAFIINKTVSKFERNADKKQINLFLKSWLCLKNFSKVDCYKNEMKKDNTVFEMESSTYFF